MLVGPRVLAGDVPPRVTIETGALSGTRFGPAAAETAFLGIPFAAPPTGAARWRPPQAVKKWAGTRSAAAFAPACPQMPSSWWPEMAGRERLETSEDCLYLNVWTTNSGGASKQPVMVWIHGGGNVEGSSQIPPLAPALTRRGVVVVSVEYRLGVFGFLAHPQLSLESPQHSSGNYGLLDQIAALQWVKRNISAFGGDPDRVTIFGESSGGEDVCHLMASPLAASLFQRAILESGVCMDSVYPDRKTAEALGTRLARALGIPTTAGAVAALRALPAEKLLAGAHGLDGAEFGASVDGWVMPDQPATIFDRGGNARVAILAGSNANESTVFGKPSPLAVSNSWPNMIGKYRQWLRSEFHEFAAEVFRAYPAATDDAASAAFLRVQTDSQFGFGSYRIAQALARQGWPAYLYYFTYRGKGPFAALGAFHSEELMFVGDTYWKSWIPSQTDHNLARVVGDYWTQFARTGNPNGKDLPHWPAYDSLSGSCLELGEERKQMQVPNREGYAVFEHILQVRLREAGGR